MQTAKQRKTRAVREFGDFQTPFDLASRATETLVRLGIQPRSVLEPTCGRGAFVSAAAARFSDARVFGVEINRAHLAIAETKTIQLSNVTLSQGDFFKFDWKALIAQTEGPWLIIGNPPWVTSSELGSIDSGNLPQKSNFHGRAGIEAITGKSNFDISEWMLLRYLDWLEGHQGVIAVLCKTTVARKILLSIWKSSNVRLQSARIFKIDAPKHFGAAVDACFLVLELDPASRVVSCDVFADLSATVPEQTFGFQDGHVVSDISAFTRYRDLLEPEREYIWRSGIKHDCSKVMELSITSAGYRNGLGESAELEEEFLFPLLKSSDIANGRIHCRNSMLVTQRSIGEDTRKIERRAPQTWQYLMQHAALLEKRASVIYKDKPPFSIFGVGVYSFAPWKVAISALYKRLHFAKVGPLDGKPVVFDDTIYFLACWSEAEADFLKCLLQSEPAMEFLHSMIHWDEKRPITVEILKCLNIRNLSRMLGREREYRHFTDSREVTLFDSAEIAKTA